MPLYKGFTITRLADFAILKSCPVALEATHVLCPVSSVSDKGLVSLGHNQVILPFVILLSVNKNSGLVAFALVSKM